MIHDSVGEFERRYALSFVEKLGDRKDGTVLNTQRGTAVKFLYDRDTYNRELRAFRAIEVAGINQIHGHFVPRLYSFDNALQAIEMTIVSPPFLLDFAAAYTDEEIERFAFDDDVLAERESHWSEIFAERWPDVMMLRDSFYDHTGLILLDLSLNNVRFK